MNTYERFAKEEAQRGESLLEQSEAIGQAISKAAADGEKAIEHGTVGTYKAIENGVVGAYQKTEDFFVGKFLTHPGETVEEAKDRLKREQAERERKNKP